MFVSTDSSAIEFTEKSEITACLRVFGAYAQSKWVAEKMVTQYEPVLPESVHRFGLLIPERQSAERAARDWLSLFIQGLSALGVYPSDYDATLSMDFTPLDYAAKAMVLLSLDVVQAQRQIFHICGRNVYFSELLAAMRDENIQLRGVSKETFQAKARAAG
ncbi:MAG TPA: hypothetical protein EYO59_01230, partial [Chromatiaceae bacterium]|nr:hypothetical protein [Chromatiaceae bacterium]